MAEPSAWQLKVTVVTPRGKSAEVAASKLVAPGVLGEFGILPGHVPFLTALKPGALVMDAQGNRRVLAVGPGFLQVGAQGAVEVLVEQAVESQAVDAATTQADLESAEAALRKWNKSMDAEWKTLDAKRAWAAAQLEARRRAAS